MDILSEKQNYVQTKDLGSVYSRIYEEKISQSWRFSHIDFANGEDADDEKWYDSEDEETETEIQEQTVTESQD